MTDSAPLDALRRLPPPLARAVLAEQAREQGDASVAALRWSMEAQLRPAQRIPATLDEWPAILVLTGQFRAGKSFLARAIFLDALHRYRVEQPRIMAATKAAVASDVVGSRSTPRSPGGGLLDMIPPWVATTWEPSVGYAGRLVIDGAEIQCIGAEGGAGAVGGPGCGLCLADDFAKWVRLNGAAAAEDALQAVLSNMSGGPGRLLLPTTPDGAGLVLQIASAVGRSVAVWDLGTAQDNAGNLAEAYSTTFVPALADAGMLDLGASAESPWKAVDFAGLRLDVCPPLVELCISIDPNKGAGCEVGIVGGGRDAGGTIHTRYDRSERCSGGEWAAIAWSLAEQLQADHPGAPWHFVVESNTGARGNVEPLLRAEEQLRTSRRRGGLVLPSTCEVRHVRSDKDKCARARPSAALALQRPPRVRHAPGLGRLEGQLRQLTPAGTRSDRADAAVHLVNDLAGLSDERGAREAREAEAAQAATRAAFVGFDGQASRMPRVDFDLDRA